jgi:hypothetical protein
MRQAYTAGLFFLEARVSREDDAGATGWTELAFEEGKSSIHKGCSRKNGWIWIMP